MSLTHYTRCHNHCSGYYGNHRYRYEDKDCLFYIPHTHTAILTDEREMVIMQADQTTIIHRKVILCDTELQDKAVKTNTEARYDAEDTGDDNTLR